MRERTGCSTPNHTNHTNGGPACSIALRSMPSPGRRASSRSGAEAPSLAKRAMPLFKPVRAFAAWRLA